MENSQNIGNSDSTALQPIMWCLGPVCDNTVPIIRCIVRLAVHAVQHLNQITLLAVDEIYLLRIIEFKNGCNMQYLALYNT